MAIVLNHGICRCCSSEGTFKDVKSKYHWMGEEEVYGDMLKDCFNISLYMEGCEGSGICEVCITQLRNAANFKKQVLHSEQRFLKVIVKKDGELPVPEAEIQIEKLKDNEEMEVLSDHFADGDVLADPDFMPEVKVEMIEEPKPKKRVIKAIASSSTAKESVAEKTTTTKRTLQLKGSTQPLVLIKRDNMYNKEWLKLLNDKERPGRKPTEELKKHLHNAKEIMKHTNATPIGRHEDTGFMCSFCDSVYLDPRDLKEHTIEVHDIEKDWQKYKFVTRMDNYLLKLDVTSLECKVCRNEIDSFDNLIQHLEINHDLLFYKDIKNQIIPFQFGGDLFKCIACPTVFNRFKALLEHMCSHYGNYTCEICGRRCINKRKYGSHKGTHVVGEFPCDSCSKVFNTIKKKKLHQQKVHLGVWSHKCAHCHQKFPDYDKKLIHLKLIHGVQYNSLTCQACGKEYRKKKLLTEHIRRNHLMERSHGCQYCEKSFFTQHELKDHLYKHSKKKDFICELCSKCFASKKRLLQHIRIHSTERRFKCFHCEFASVHKSSWRHHMQTKHNATV